MKILQVISDSNIGGAGILLESLLRHTKYEKKDITVVLPRGAALASRYEALGVRVLPVLPDPDRSFSVGNTRVLRRLLAADPPDILHTHASLSARVAAALVARGKTVVVSTRHCAYSVGREGTLLRRWRNRLGERLLTDCTVATARAALDNLVALGIPPSRIRLIRNGAEELARPATEESLALRRRLGIPDAAFVCGMSARLVPVKGHETLLRAAKILLSRHTGYHFLFVGGGSEGARLAALARELGVDAHLTMVGEVQNVAPYTALFDAAVNCSVGTETSCLALSEAMSLGVPLVVSRYGGNVEMVREGENGMLFPPRDAAALAAAIERLASDRVLYERLSRGARARFVRELHADGMAARYDALYAELREKKGKRR